MVYLYCMCVYWLFPNQWGMKKVCFINAFPSIPPDMGYKMTPKAHRAQRSIIYCCASAIMGVLIFIYNIKTPIMVHHLFDSEQWHFFLVFKHFNKKNIILLVNL